MGNNEPDLKIQAVINPLGTNFGTVCEREYVEMNHSVLSTMQQVSNLYSMKGTHLKKEKKTIEFYKTTVTSTTRVRRKVVFS